MSQGMPQGVLVGFWLLILARCVSVDADVYTYVVKSVNLTGALRPAFYVALDPAARVGGGLSDFQAVHALQSTDGGYVLSGKAAKGDTATGAFAIKLDARGKYSWGWRAGDVGAANAAVQLSSSGAILVAGWRRSGSTAVATLWRLDPVTGKEIWTAPFADGGGRSSAFEMASLDTDGLLLCGVRNKPSDEEMSFKSYGHVWEGTARVLRLPMAALVGAAAPTPKQVAWDWAAPGYFTAHSAKMTRAGSVAVLLYGGTADKSAALAMLHGSDGTALWGPLDYGAGFGEGNSHNYIGHNYIGRP